MKTFPAAAKIYALVDARADTRCWDNSVVCLWLLDAPGKGAQDASTYGKRGGRDHPRITFVMQEFGFHPRNSNSISGFKLSNDTTNSAVRHRHHFDPSRSRGGPEFTQACC